MSLGRTISKHRKLKELRQVDLAEQLGVHQSHVARWERDQMRPSDKYLQRLAEVLEVPPAELLHDEVNGFAAGIDDEELLELVKQIPRLTERQKDILKLLLQDMVKLSRFQEVMQS